jgi:predicted acylesterase/phospholipase RssA
MVVPSNSPTQKIQIGHKQKIAFVCSGGAAKAGAFHLGVALALQEQGFKFCGGTLPNSGPRPPEPMEISTYVGSSAGAVISSYLAAGYSLDNIFNSFLGRKPNHEDPSEYLPRVLPRLTYQKLYKIKPGLAKDQFIQFMRLRQTVSDIVEGNWESLVQMKWLKATGIFSTSGIEHYMREEVLPSNRFQDYAADLFIVATQLNHSKKVVFGKYKYKTPSSDLSCSYENNVDISDACAASTALPVIFAPHGIKDENNQTVYYIDGEIRDTLSTHVAMDGNADLVIASYTHQPYHVLDEGKSLTDHGLSAIVIQSIYLLIEQKINQHIHNKQAHRNAINAVMQYCKTQGLSSEHRDRICQIMEVHLHHRMDMDTIYIHPNPTDAQLFFGDHFTLSPRKMTEIVKSGFRAAIDTLRRYEFADRKRKHAMGMTESIV